MTRGLAVLAGLCVAYAALYYQAQLGNVWRSGDFAALWSYGQILHTGGAAALYDPDRLQALQTDLGLPADERNPFPYPPGFLLAIWPLGLVPFGAGFVAWIIVTLGLYLWACRGRLGWLAVVAPGTTIGVIAGQTGFLTGALFLGGLRLVATRPWLGGALLGLLTIKPQLGVLIPVALTAARAWRAMAAAALAASALTTVSLLVFGPGALGQWLESLPGYAAIFAGRSVRYGMMPTVTANLTMLGVPGVTLLQAAATLAAAALVWVTWRPSTVDPAEVGPAEVGPAGPGSRAWLILAAATFLATPHAFVYDMPLLTGAALLYGSGDPRGRAGVVAAVLVLPAAMLWSGPVPLSTPVLAALAAALWLGGRPRRVSTA